MSEEENDDFEKTTQSATPAGARSGGFVNHVGTTVSGRYELKQLVGQGGMGALYAGHHIEIGRKVAVKVLHNKDLHVSEEIFLRFKQEATLAATLTHNNICSVYDFGRLEDGTPYLVMDLLQGKTLADLIARESRIEPRRAVRIVAQICEALTHAHDKGVAHRDLKPSNIMIENEQPNELAKIVDFGIAKSLEEDAPKLTAAHEAIGSPYYMSPEQCQAGPIDHRTDIYSLGCLMYECLTGRTPFKASNALQMMFSHVHNEPDPFRVAVPDADIPPALEEVVLKAMRKNPDDRFQNAEELKQAAFASVGAITIDCLANLPTITALQKQLATKAQLDTAVDAGSRPLMSKKVMIVSAIAALLTIGAVAFGVSNADNIALILDGRRPGYIYNGDDSKPYHWNLGTSSDPQQVHGVYLGQAHDTPRSADNDLTIMGHATVHVTQRTADVILVLNSHAQVEWNIVKDPGTKIEKVLICSDYGESQVKGVPENILQRIGNVSLSLSENENLMENSYFVTLVKEVKDVTGKPINTFQYAQQLKAFEI